jgi:cardiolipin synthase
VSLNFANKLSISRILSVPFFVFSLLYYNPQRDFLRYISLGIFLLAVITDFVDGYIARKSRQKTEAGAILDPLADKLLLLSAFLCLSFIRLLPKNLRLPIWVLIIFISRDIIILLGSAVIYIVRGNLQLSPTLWGKLTTLFQTLTIITLLLQLKFSTLFWILAVIFTLISGIDYIRRGLKILYIP